MEFIGPAWHNNISELFDAIPAFAAQNLHAIEVGIASTTFLDHTNAAEIDRLIRDLKAADLRVNSVHAPFGPSIDFSSFDDRVHERGVAALIEAIELSRALGARYTIIHPGDGIVTTDRSKRLDRSAGVIRELAVVAEESEVILAVENMITGYLCDEAPELLRLLDAARSSSVGVCFDTGHANIGTNLKDEARRLLPRTVTTHIHDNDGLDDLHLFPGHGSIHWPTFANLFHTTCPDASMLIECEPPNGWDWPMAFAELGRMLAPII